ncbi:hypothetical protein [Actinoplanes sp. NPDC089786]|uniref:hypothetical protein n=1 Tax=Actinoplanes sp. NPDC089786 TaxID=3155185 RepID=UPI0034304BE6
MSYRIEDVLESVQEGAPAPRTDTDAIIAGARRIQARRRWAAVGGAGGAAVVAVAVVVGLTGGVPRASSPGTPTAASPSAAPSKAAEPKTYTQPKKLEFSIGESRTGRFHLGPVRSVSYGYQEVPVYRDGNTMETDGVPYPFPDGMIFLYRPGAYDIKQFGVPELERDKFGPPKDITISGRPGIERTLSYTVPDLTDMRAKLRNNPRMKPNDPSIKTLSRTKTAVAWKYDGEAWATFVPWTTREELSRDETLKIVEALNPQQAVEPIRAPYTFGWLPVGWRPIAAEQNAAGTSEFLSTVKLDRKVPTGGELSLSFDNYPFGGELRIFHGKPKDGNAPAQGKNVTCTDVNGYCRMTIDSEHFAEFQKVGPGLSMDDVRHILRELTFTTLADQSTWKPLS